MGQKIASIKGVPDVLPPQIHLWQAIEEAARRIFPTYGYDEIRPAVIEKTELFTRSIGQETDVVSKEMYSFTDKGEDNITLRPEGTAGVVRAFVENFAQTEPSARLWYLGPMFRRERPQKGRYRQFWQLGAEAFGQKSARVDAELLAMLSDLFEGVGLKGVALHVASIGDAKCRPAYKTKLQEFLRARIGDLCEDCKARVEKNPLRVLDCKKEGCRAATANAPRLMDHLCEECRAHFDELRRSLDVLKVSYEIDPRIVRGLDYYMRTAFELIHTGEGLGSQNAVGGGGRYDGLVKELGGPPEVAGVGFGLGMERLVLALEAQRKAERIAPDAFLAPLGAAAVEKAMVLARELRAKGLRVEMDYEGKKGLGNLLDRANKKGARAAVILGEDELARGVAKVKDLATGEQREVALAGVADSVKRK